MTVAELIAELQKQDQHKPVRVGILDHSQFYEADSVTNEGSYVLIDSR